MHLLRLCLLHLGGVVVTFLALDYSQKALSQAVRLDTELLHLLLGHLEDVINGNSFPQKDLKKLLESVPLKELLHPDSLIVGKAQLQGWLPLDWSDRYDRLEHLRVPAGLEHVVGNLLERGAHVVKVTIELFKVKGDLVRVLFENIVGGQHLQIFPLYSDDKLQRRLGKLYFSGAKQQTYIVPGKPKVPDAGR